MLPPIPTSKSRLIVFAQASPTVHDVQPCNLPSAYHQHSLAAACAPNKLEGFRCKLTIFAQVSPSLSSPETGHRRSHPAAYSNALWGVGLIFPVLLPRNRFEPHLIIESIRGSWQKFRILWRILLRQSPDVKFKYRMKITERKHYHDEFIEERINRARDPRVKEFWSEVQKLDTDLTISESDAFEREFQCSRNLLPINGN
ncbi:unnamed protein product [Haemonchus placei]|uniref:Uncharacterized protein n=1 Tax=Haemonchus placei TaxID=6290 RepID=A0A0N4WLP7_HAEPC|nr:unnamed protein product [Haemonchus placei]